MYVRVCTQPGWQDQSASIFTMQIKLLCPVQQNVLPALTAMLRNGLLLSAAGMAGVCLLAGTVGTVAQPNWSTYDETAKWLEDTFEDLGPVWYDEYGKVENAYEITISGAKVVITQSGRGNFDDGWRWAAGVIHGWI